MIIELLHLTHRFARLDHLRYDERLRLDEFSMRGQQALQIRGYLVEVVGAVYDSRNHMRGSARVSVLVFAR